MKKIHMGLYSYTIEGDREEEAAAEMEKRLDYLGHMPGVRCYTDALEAIRESIADTFHVKIGAIIGW